MQTGSTAAYKTNAALGFSYIGLMIFVAISGIALAGIGIVWSQDQQREREKELLFIGEQYRQAIGSYYESTPGNIKQYPTKLEDLLLDDRSQTIKRHLRKIYNDPITNTTEWGLELQKSKIIGVSSLSEMKPIKKKGFPILYEKFSEFSRYSDWKFIYIPVTANAAPETAPS
jgi:type II secretory pathway pseudopilin PulG